MSPPDHGSCFCKEIEFEVAAELIVVSFCYFKNCKKCTGTVFTTNVVFPNNNTMRFTKGQNLVSDFKDTVQESDNALSHKFCSLCSSPLYDAGCDFGRTLSVFYSALDDFNVLGEDGIVKEAKPHAGFYFKDRASWVDPVEGAEQPKTKPGRDLFTDLT